MKEKIVELFDIGAKEGAKRLRSLGFSEPETALRNLKTLSEGAFAPLLDDILDLSAASPSPDNALNNLESISNGLGEGLITESLSDGGETLAQLVTIFGSSAYL